MTALSANPLRVLSRERATPSAVRTPGLALTVAGAMPVVLLAGWLAADALQPSRYSPVRQTISVAAGHAGTDRWVGTTALLAIGLGYLLTAVALPGVGRPGRLGLLATGICGVGVALCPEAASGPTSSHEAFSVLGAVLLAAGPLFTLRPGDADAGWAQRPGGAFVATVVFVLLTAFLVVELNAGHLAGAAERLAVTVETAWPLAVVLLQPKLTTDVISELSRSRQSASGAG